MRLTLILSLLLSVHSFAGGFPFPNGNYSYAKLYFYNINWDQKGRPDYHIFDGRVYAASKIGDGITMDQKVLDQIHGIMVRGVDEMLMGMAKCYIPRHGIIYYDENNEPIASLSMCFECEKISYWTKNEFDRHGKDIEDYDMRKAEKQFKELRKTLEDANILVADSIETYLEVAEADPGFHQEGTITFTRGNFDSLYYDRYTSEEVKNWSAKSYGSVLKEDINEEYSAGGEKYEFRQLRNSLGTQFDFSSNEDDAYLMQAQIVDPYIATPFGLQVGMSLDQVKDFVGLWDGISHPKEITIKGDKVAVVLKLEMRTVQSITIYYDYLP